MSGDLKKTATDIIPHRQVFARNENNDALNLKAVCFFAAAGFFLERDTYYKNLEVLQPAHNYFLDENNYIKKYEVNWNWNYNPREIGLKQATEEFAELFEKITFNDLKGKDVILPLSGGLDSRTQAVAAGKDLNIKCYSYKFSDSFDETKYGREICRLNKLDFTEYTIPEGYLWNVIERLSEINSCYADFTHPRQMAVIDEISKLGNIFYLGHWGDVLFDDMGADSDLTFDEQVDFVIKKIFKKGGAELAELLWDYWGLDGDFKNHVKERISLLLDKIKIDNTNARIRAFKSLYWAPRWTSANLNVFSDFHPVSLPYYNDEMCKFICTIPEELLADRQIQIEYIKMKNPETASVPWQSYDPLNLYNYKQYGNISGVPGRILKKGKRILKETIKGKKLTTRNWEIQFTGKKNDTELRKHLFENPAFEELVSKEIVKKIYESFKTNDQVYYSHPLSMLLTLSVFAKNQKKYNEQK